MNPVRNRMNNFLEKFLLIFKNSFLIILSYFILIFIFQSILVFLYFLTSNFNINIVWDFLTFWFDAGYDKFFLYNVLFLILLPAHLEIYLAQRIKKFYEFILTPLVGIFSSLGLSLFIPAEDGDMKGLAIAAFWIIAAFYHLVFGSFVAIHYFHIKKAKI